ncbi:unnamed protein product [Candidula unifasciata]|uniref:DUF19 domain-containing protein n=1 Tax=Candidula unifasciata TaxID=100452 RepID=A0A8S3Z405_9EUPU|nr:unnamed protein product [Candidula unifasciata]
MQIMAFNILHFFVLCVFIPTMLCAVMRVKRSCAEVKGCLRQFPMIVDLVEKDKAGALVTLTYEVLLNDVCSKQEELKTCLAQTTCSVFEQSYTGRATRDVLSYICGAGREALLSEASCFSRDDFELGIYQCSKAMKLETDIAALQIQTGIGDSTSFCSVFDSLLKCVQLNVQRSCSHRAADFASSVYGHTIKALAKHIGCTFNFKS